MFESLQDQPCNWRRPVAAAAGLSLQSRLPSPRAGAIMLTPRIHCQSGFDDVRPDSYSWPLMNALLIVGAALVVLLIDLIGALRSSQWPFPTGDSPLGASKIIQQHLIRLLGFAIGFVIFLGITGTEDAPEVALGSLVGFTTIVASIWFFAPQRP